MAPLYKTSTPYSGADRIALVDLDACLYSYVLLTPEQLCVVYPDLENIVTSRLVKPIYIITSLVVKISTHAKTGNVTGHLVLRHLTSYACGTLIWQSPRGGC